jgi:hypothetical protein
MMPVSVVSSVQSGHFEGISESVDPVHGISKPQQRFRQVTIAETPFEYSSTDDSFAQAGKAILHKRQTIHPAGTLLDIPP